MGCRFEVREEPISDLTEHATIPAVFEARSRVDVEFRNGEYSFRVREIDAPFTKDYDEVENPMGWPWRFDLSRWGLFAAFAGARRIGGAIAAYATDGVEMLEDRKNLVVVWDLRVWPDVRRWGVGSALFRTVEDWARARGCRELKVETQDVNVVACRFYAKQGCTLAEINPLAYPELPDEAQLIWRKRL